MSVSGQQSVPSPSVSVVSSKVIVIGNNNYVPTPRSPTFPTSKLQWSSSCRPRPPVKSGRPPLYSGNGVSYSGRGPTPTVPVSVGVSSSGRPRPPVVKSGRPPLYSGNGVSYSGRPTVPVRDDNTSCCSSTNIGRPTVPVRDGNSSFCPSTNIFPFRFTCEPAAKKERALSSPAANHGYLGLISTMVNEPYYRHTPFSESLVLAKYLYEYKCNYSQCVPLCTIKEVVDEDVDVLDASAASTDLVIEPSRSVPGLASGKRRRVFLPTLKEWVVMVNKLPVVKTTSSTDLVIEPSGSVPGRVSGKRHRVLIPTTKEWTAMVNQLPPAKMLVDPSYSAPGSAGKRRRVLVHSFQQHDKYPSLTAWIGIVNMLPPAKMLVDPSYSAPGLVAGKRRRVLVNSFKQYDEIPLSSLQLVVYQPRHLVVYQPRHLVVYQPRHLLVYQPRHLVVCQPTPLADNDIDDSFILNHDESDEEVEVVQEEPSAAPSTGELRGSITVNGLRRSARLYQEELVGSVNVNGLRRSARVMIRQGVG